MDDERVERVLGAVRALSQEQRQQLLLMLWQEYGQPSQESLSLAFTSTQIEGPTDYVLVFDGGSQGNPGPGYGSYLVEHASDGGSVVRLDFGEAMTNNEAEYRTVIAALEGLIARIRSAGRDPAAVSLEVRGDSALVLRQVEGSWKAKDDRMRVLRNRVRKLLGCFKGYRLVLQGRAESVRVLGH